MLIFGGRGNDEGVVHVLDLKTMKWSSLNNLQYKRYGHTVNLIGSSIYLFGGYSGGYQNDLHKYDVNSKTLQLCSTIGASSARSCHGSAVVEDNLYIFGGNGFASTRRDNTLYSLNTISSEWLAIPIAESSGSLPQPRVNMSMFSFE